MQICAENQTTPIQTMKKILVLAGALVALLAQQASATVNISLANGEDDGGTAARVISYEQWKGAGGSSTKNISTEVPLLTSNPNRIYQLSLASSDNSHTPQVRQNVMKWLSGLSVPMDRTYDPTAVYLIPRASSGMASTSGLQLYDCASTGFPFWRGQTPPNTNNPMIVNATGHRDVCPVILSTNKVSKYWVRVTSTSPTIGNALFPVATNSTSGQEIGFNPQYIAIGPGGNGVLDSFPDPSTGQWVKVGDDEIFVSGFPSSAGIDGHYKWVLRFGSTIAVTVTDYASFSALKNEFASNNIMLKVELLLKDGESEQVLDSYTVQAALPGLRIDSGTNSTVTLTVLGGQDMLVHQLETRPGLSGTWTNAHDDLLQTGRSWAEIATSPMAYFRARQTSGQ